MQWLIDQRGPAAVFCEKQNEYGTMRVSVVRGNEEQTIGYVRTDAEAKKKAGRWLYRHIGKKA